MKKAKSLNKPPYSEEVSVETAAELIGYASLMAPEAVTMRMLAMLQSGILQAYRTGKDGEVLSVRVCRARIRQMIREAKEAAEKKARKKVTKKKGKK